MARLSKSLPPIHEQQLSTLVVVLMGLLTANFSFESPKTSF